MNVTPLLCVAAVSKMIKQNCELHAVTTEEDAGDKERGGAKEKGDRVQEMLPGFVYITADNQNEGKHLTVTAPWTTPGLLTTLDYLISEFVLTPP